MQIVNLIAIEMNSDPDSDNDPDTELSGKIMNDNHEEHEGHEEKNRKLNLPSPCPSCSSW